jgi:uncharacterized protein YggU (UPF0235/DUF167 family)
MKILVKAKPSSKVSSIERLSSNEFLISVKEPAVAGKANKAVINMLADYFEISKNRINILVGQITKNKIIEIN